jgi:succinate dehydrogenase / fumarate reductase flavoprotein subunit
MELKPKIPSGPIEKRWDQHKFEMKLVNPANKRKYNIIVVGSGLAGASAAATMGELGYNVKCFCFQDSPRRAHSIAAQGGINAAKNYQNDGDSVYRLFYDTVKGGDFRARESNVYRLAQISLNIIDQCVAQGVPFAREYGGMLANRSFGGAQRRGLPERRRRALHRRQNQSSGSASAGPAGTSPTCSEHGGASATGIVRQLHQYRRMRSRLPEAD